MIDRALGKDIRRLVDESVPAAPWLEDRVIAAVADAAGNKAPGRHYGRPLFSATTGLVAVLAAVLVVATLIGSLSARQIASPGSQLTPSRDPAVVGYRLTLYQDMNTVHHALQKRLSCTVRQLCITALVQTRAATETLLTDMAGTPAPTQIEPYAADVQAAADQFVNQLTLAVNALSVKGSDYRIVYTPTIGDLDRAVAVIECWPVEPVAVDTANGYGCNAFSTGG